MSKVQIVNTLEAPEAVSPYSQGVRIQASSSLLFVSGQLPIDPKTGKLIEGNIEEMTARILMNIQAILKAGGSDLSKVIKTEVFMTDLNDFKLMNKEYAKFFPEGAFPARQAIEVSRLPLDAPLEISCIAIADM